MISLGSDAVDFPLRVDELFADAGGQFAAQRIRAISRVPAAHPVAAWDFTQRWCKLVQFTERFYPEYKDVLLNALSPSPQADPHSAQAAC